MRDAIDDGRKALKIVKKSDGKSRIIALYTELTLLKMTKKNGTDYIIQAEKAVTSLIKCKRK